MTRKLTSALLAFMTIMSEVGCGGGGGGGGNSSGAEGANFNCDGSCPNTNLTTADVDRILRQGADQAARLGMPATIAVLDRVGNVLALYRMPGAPLTTHIDGQVGAAGGLEGISAPTSLAAISKAGTGAYLSSQGNAFSTRTASQIVQENFLPQEQFKPGGPLFGVQFSQLLCSDVTVLNPSLSQGTSAGGKAVSTGLTGPRPLPLGLSADPGGIPLYKNGDLVGGVGVEFDGLYTVDRVITDTDDAPEERVALAASIGFEAPSDRTGDQIFVGGRSFRYTDLTYQDLDAPSEELPALEEAGLLTERFYSDGRIKAGAVFGTVESGVAASVRAGVPTAVLVSAGGGPRFPSRSGTSLGGAELSAAEVEALLDSAILTAHRARAAIRTPRDTPARVSIWVVDTAGSQLGFVRSQDAPVFGIDVSLQKARSALFFSSADSDEALASASPMLGANYAAEFAALSGGRPTGGIAWSARAIGNVARPFFPDGINGNPNGPFSLPFPGLGAGRTWSPFNTGLQLDLALGGIAVPLGLAGSPAVPSSCTSTAVFGNRLRNGLQIFAGGVPLYRGNTLIGAIGISGDGIDQDDMVAFYSSSRRGLDYAGHTGVGDPDLGFNAPREIRSDSVSLVPQNTGLRYVNCPEGPFIADNDQNVCEGL